MQKTDSIREIIVQPRIRREPARFTMFTRRNRRMLYKGKVVT